ncbi:MAG: HPP family protein [Thermoplasmata archaeon]|nr:HPP family protein [Thermoplasmata archaeon]
MPSKEDVPKGQRSRKKKAEEHSTIIDKKLMKGKGKAWNYVLQSWMAMVTVMMVLLVLDPVTEGIVVASMGASAFIVFAMPKQVTANPRNVVGGQTVGVLTGGLCYLLFIWEGFTCLLGSGSFGLIFAVGLSVGLSTFFMAATDTEHPPASGTAVGIVIAGWSWEVALFIILAASMLSFAKFMLKRWLVDLL